MKNFEIAKQLLAQNNYTCVLCCDDMIYTSEKRGVCPLVEWLEDDSRNFSGASAADKVVGRGAAFLYVLLGVREGYANVISHAAIEVLRGHDVTVEYSIAVERIINRKGDGICPFEETVLCITDAKEAYYAIKQKMCDMGIA